MADLKRGGGFPPEAEESQRALGGRLSQGDQRSRRLETLYRASSVQASESRSEGSATEKRKSLQYELYTHRACFPGSPGPVGSGVKD